MTFDREKLRQAGQEFAFAFAVTFLPLALAFLQGVHTGDKIVVPDYGTVRAFVTAAAGSAAIAGLKAAVWYLTGTKAPKDT